MSRLKRKYPGSFEKEEQLLFGQARPKPHQDKILPPEILLLISNDNPFLNLSSLNKTMRKLYYTKNPLRMLDNWLILRFEKTLQINNNTLDTLVHYQLAFQEQFSVENYNSPYNIRRELIYVTDIPVRSWIIEFVNLISTPHADGADAKAETSASAMHDMTKRATYFGESAAGSATSAASSGFTASAPTFSGDFNIKNAEMSMSSNAKKMFPGWDGDITWSIYSTQVREGNPRGFFYKKNKKFTQFVNKLDKSYPTFSKFIITKLYKWYKTNYLQSNELSNFIKAVPNTFVFSQVFGSFEKFDWSHFFQTGELKLLGPDYKIQYLPGNSTGQPNILFLTENGYHSFRPSQVPDLTKIKKHKIVFLDRFLHRKKLDLSLFKEDGEIDTWRIVETQENMSDQEMEEKTIVNDHSYPTPSLERTGNFNVFGSKFTSGAPAYMVTDFNLEYEVLFFKKFVHNRYKQATTPSYNYVLDPTTMPYNYTLDPEVLLRLSILLQKLKNVMNLKHG